MYLDQINSQVNLDQSFQNSRLYNAVRYEYEWDYSKKKPDVYSIEIQK